MNTLINIAYASLLKTKLVEGQSVLENHTIEDLFSLLVERYGSAVILAIVTPTLNLNDVNPFFDRTVYFLAAQNGIYPQFGNIEVKNEVCLIKRVWGGGFEKLVLADGVGELEGFRQDVGLKYNITHQQVFGVRHGIGKVPSAVVRNEQGEVVYGTVVLSTETDIIINFDFFFTGTVNLN